VRSVKSLISGFGVAISLVGAIACAFFITAALVAFHGSLQVSTSYSPRSTVLSASAKHDPPIVIHRVARRTVAGPTATTATSVPASSRVTADVSAPGRSRTVTQNPPQTVLDPPKSPPPVVHAPKPSATAPLANATAGLTDAVGGVVADATNSLGKTVGTLSPALGGVVQGLGTGLADGIVALGNAVAAVVNGLGTHEATPQG
jgi:hypothetical protein